MSGLTVRVVGLSVLASSAAWAPVAQAWGCKKFEGCANCAYLPGGGDSFWLNTDDFGANQEIEITNAAFAWNAGAGEVLRGADWTWSRVNVAFDGIRGDGNNNVRMKPEVWWEDYDEDVVATTESTPIGFTCNVNDRDLSFRGSVSFTNDLPSDSTSPSIGQTALHEFGHMLGLRHSGAVETAMNKAYPFGGDIAEMAYRIHEDDYVGLVAAKGDTSTGKTLMLSRFRRIDQGEVEEVWTAQIGNLSEVNNTWCGSPGDTISAADGPTEILASINGTSSQTPLIEWTLDSPVGACFSGPAEYSLGTRNPSISANTPYAVSPTGGYTIPNNTPIGTYKLCAKIDADDAITESSEVDNIVRSEKNFTVAVSCP